MSRPQRLFDLLSILHARRRTTVAEIADDLGVSTRTVHRDLAVLSDAGVAVVTEPGRYGGVSVLPSGRFQVSGLSAREKDLLRVTGLDVDRATELGLEALATAALDNRPWFSDLPSNGDVAALAQDVRRGNRLSIRYRRSGEDVTTERVVDPYGLHGRGGRWYLVAVVADLARSHLDLARRILGSRLSTVDDGATDDTVRISVNYSQVGGVRQLLQFGDSLEVLEPAEARTLTAQLARTILTRHE